jgi:hypothetical protein
VTTVIGAVTTAVAAVPRTYPLGKVPPSPEFPYGVFSGVLGRGDTYTLDSAHHRRMGAVTVQTFGRTIDSALDQMEKLTARLLDVALALPHCTPLRATFDTPRVVRDPDDAGVIGATQQFTFYAQES